MTRALAAALLAALLLAGVQTYRLAAEQREYADTRAQHAEQIALMFEASRLASAEFRAEEQRRTAEVQKAADEAHQALAQARADAVAASDSGQRLRDRIAAITASCGRASGNSGPAGSGQATDATADLLADVQRRLDAAADGIARFADHAYTAGTACQRGYGALTK